MTRFARVIGLAIAARAALAIAPADPAAAVCIKDCEKTYGRKGAGGAPCGQYAHKAPIPLVKQTCEHGFQNGLVYSCPYVCSHQNQEKDCAAIESFKGYRGIRNNACSHADGRVEKGACQAGFYHGALRVCTDIKKALHVNPETGVRHYHTHDQQADEELRVAAAEQAAREKAEKDLEARRLAEEQQSEKKQSEEAARAAEAQRARHLRAAQEAAAAEVRQQIEEEVAEATESHGNVLMHQQSGET